MKRAAIILAVVFGLVSLRAQTPRVSFQNSSTSLVTFASSGQPVSSSNHMVVALYGAPDGTTDESAFVLLFSSNAPIGTIPGRYSGGFQSLPQFACSDFAMIQCRAFEPAYGTTYEAALSAPPTNGRRAFIGKSTIGRIQVLCSPSAPEEVGRAVGAFTVGPAPGPPFFTVGDIVVAEGSNGTVTARFNVQLIGDTNEICSVDYATVDGTAQAGSDYIAAGGTLTFVPGETSKTVAVTVTGDAPVEPDEDFYLRLGNPVNAEIGRPQGRCIITEIRVLGLRVDTAVTFNSANGRRYVIEKALNPTNWVAVAGATNVLGTGSAMTIVDAGSGCTEMTVYRVRLLP